jgi:hypothetical protein
MDIILHNKIREQLLSEVEIINTKTIEEYWDDIKKVVTDLNIEKMTDIEDFGIMYEVHYSEDFWRCYFTIQVALQEDGEYSHMEHISLSCQIPQDYASQLKSSCEDLWIGNEETLIKVFSLVENNEYFKLLRSSISDVTIIDSTEV